MASSSLLDAALAAGTPALDSVNPGEYEGIESLRAYAIMTLMALLGLTMILGRVAEKHNINWIGEATIALVLGAGSGCVLWLLSDRLHAEYFQFFQFNTDYFFLFLLPPIIFDAGFHLDTRTVFSSLGSISLLAFVGTGVGAIVIAGTMWLLGVIHFSIDIDFFDACLFGAIISAVDPVSVLSVFGRLNADRHLSAIVFGESVINDAVAIVLYNVVYTFRQTAISGGNPIIAGLEACGSFLVIFGGSLVIGAMAAILAARLFACGNFHSPNAPVESGLVIVFAYCSFYLAKGLQLSGITTIIFCGIAMGKYLSPYLSKEANTRVGSLFGVLGHLAETTVFLFIGLSAFTDTWSHSLRHTWPFALWLTFALALSRAVIVYPMTAFCNLLTPRSGRRIPETHKHVLWFSGLRGAMAFALANLARKSLAGTPSGDAAGNLMVAGTFSMIVVTVLFNGGTIYILLERWKLTESNAGADETQESESALSNAPQTSDSARRSSSRHLRRQSSDHPIGFVRRMRGWHRSGGIISTLERWDRRIMSALLPPKEESDEDEEDNDANEGNDTGAAANEAARASSAGENGSSGTNGQSGSAPAKEGDEASVALLSGNGQ